MKKLYSLLLMAVMAVMLPRTAHALKVYLQYDDEPISQLSGKVIKKVIPSLNGDYLYILAHDAVSYNAFGHVATNFNPIIIVYDHVNKKVKEQLDLSTCISGRENEYPNIPFNNNQDYPTINQGNAFFVRTIDVALIGDIAMTEDGVLIASGYCHSSLGAFSDINNKRHHQYFYKWDNVNGVATGSAKEWGTTSNQANWNYGRVGWAIAYNGTMKDGYLWYTSYSSQSYSMRYCRVHVTNGVFPTVTAATQMNYWLEDGNYTASNLGNPYFIQFPASWGMTFSGNVYANASNMRPFRFNFQETNSGGTGRHGFPTGVTSWAAASYTAMDSHLDLAARHTPIFQYNGGYYVVGAQSNGIAVANVTSGLGTATGAGVVLDKNINTNDIATSAAAGATVNDNMTLFVVDQAGRISKYSEVPHPTVSISANTTASNGRQYANISIAHTNAHTYELQKLNGSTWTTVYSGAIEGTKTVEITAETTFRVIAYNGVGVSATSNQVTVQYNILPAPTAEIQLIDNGTTEDAKISWNAVDGAVSYSIEKSTDGTTWSSFATGVTAQTYTDAGVQLAEELYYRVYAVDVNGVKSPASNVVSVWPAFEPYQPTITGQTWNGHSKVELNWEIPSENIPSSYNVYCDGVLIASGVEVAHYVHYGVPAGNHEYYIESVYDSRPGITGQSNTLIITVEPRAVGNVMYRIEEEYNYPIDDTFASQTGLPLFDNQDLYRQGKLFMEDDRTWSWYISQRSSAASIGGDTSSDGGGVVRFKADAGSASAMASSGEKILSYTPDASVGLAMDEQGNIFVRERTPYPVQTGNGAAGANSAWGFSSHFTKGTVYKRHAGGTYSTSDKKTYDFSDLGLTLNRADYYAAEGNIFDGNGSVYIAPCLTEYDNGSNGNHNFYKVFIEGGVYNKNKLTIIPEHSGFGAENFFFPIMPNQDDARDDYIVQLRSNAYVNVSNDGTQRQVIYSTKSRVHNAGGTTAWFNGDMFLITPEFMGSKNTGDFYIAKAVKDDLSKVKHPSEAVFSEATMVPIASVSYDKNEDVPAMNANAVWFGCVPHEGVSGAANVDNVFNETYMDIYEYIPGVRFAKYKLIPYLEILNPSVTMVVDVETDPEATTITNFVGKAAWKELSYPGEDFKLKYFHVNITKEGLGTPLMSFYVKQVENASSGHDHIICDVNGNAVESDIEILTEERNEYDANGVLTSREWCYVLLDGAKYDIGDFEDCVLAVKATFEKVNEVTTTIESDYSQATDDAYYRPQEPKGTVVIDQEGVPFKVRDQWTAFPDGPKENGEDGYWSYKWHVNYRIDIDFSKVTATSDDDVTLPVSHYEIYYVPFGSSLGAVSEPVMNFTLLSSDGNLTKTDGKIPGTYDFTKKDYAIPVGDGTSQLKPSVMSFYIQPEVEVTSDNPGKGQFTLKNVNDNPVNGEFYVRAVYAANAYAKIRKTTQSLMSESEAQTTSVENALVNLSARDYITPNVTSDYTVAHCTGSIANVVIYNMNGGVVANIPGHGDCRQQIDVGDLASGIYFVSINGGKAHRLVKK